MTTGMAARMRIGESPIRLSSAASIAKNVTANINVRMLNCSGLRVDCTGAAARGELVGAGGGGGAIGLDMGD